jgi:hypothetical protein
MAMKMNGTGTLPAKLNDPDQKLGCYRLWMRPKTSRKDSRKRSHSIFGHYPNGARK